MSPGPLPEEAAIADIEGNLARLGVQVEAVQALLVRMLQDVVKAQAGIDHDPRASLVEVNERLVIAALKSHEEAEAASRALASAARSAALDPLTGLPDRTITLDRFSRAIVSSRRRRSRSAVLFLVIDDFKALNDAHGHPFADAVLQHVARRMRAVVREDDTVSRHGGDEFLILLAEVSQPGDARKVAEKVLGAIAAPAQIDGRTVSMTASVGIAIYPDDGQDAATLVALANAAMHASKRRRSGDLGPNTGQTGSVAGLPGALVDTRPSAIQRHNQDLRDANERLILAALSARELKEAAELARQRQSALMAAVAEELRNPLAPVRVAAAMLGRGGLEEPMLPRVQVILEEQLSQISRLVGQFDGSSEQAPAPLELHRQSVDLSAVIDAAVAVHKKMMDARGQRFEKECPPGRLDVQGDAELLKQVVSNLLDNASKHTYDGGRIMLSVTLSDDMLTLTVSDNGIGITQAVLPHIYAPFVQDPQVLGFNGVGLGIGLTVVRTLVRAHGGTLTAHSSGARGGSRFVVTLPRVAGVSDPAGADTLRVPRSTGEQEDAHHAR